MRLRNILALLSSAAPAFAQGKAAQATPVGPDSAAKSASATAQAPSPAPTVVSPSANAATPQGPLTRVEGLAAQTRLRTQLAILNFSGPSKSLPSVEAFTVGNRVIPAGAVLDSAVGVIDGSLEVFGTITGTVLVIDGNLRVHAGAKIDGDAIAIRGRAMNQGGTVTGEMRSLNSVSASADAKVVGPPHTTWWAIKLTLSWFAVLVIIGVGVMIFAEANLDGVVLTLERGIGRAFMIGLLGEIAALPFLVLLCVALALTVIGILLIPFAIVAFFIAGAGLVTLGFLAVSRLSGIPAVRPGALTARGVNLRAMFIGLTGYMGLWLIAAIFMSQPMVGGVLRAIAIVVTWVVATAGLGATLASRGGTRRPGSGRSAKSGGDELSWQTPTPVSGVAAARRK